MELNIHTMLAGKYTYLGEYIYKYDNTEKGTQKIDIDDSNRYKSLFERGLEATGYGKFHFLLFILVGLTYASVAMEITMVSFVLPSAKCDFEMSSKDAGYLTALPMLGMTVGSFFWGCLADLIGRKYVMVASLLSGGLAGIASAFSQYFTVFLILRFINGFAMVGALSLSLPFLGEFQPSKYREKVLCWMELFWTTGIIGTPCLAWLIIPMTFGVEMPLFKFVSWNLFVIASATPPILLGAWATYFPESPKYLYDSGSEDEALEVLRYMFAKNTGKNPSFYPIETLVQNEISVIGGMEQIKFDRPKKTLRSLLKNLGQMTNSLFKPPLRNRTLLVLWISFGLSASYYTLMMWFPELFTRFRHYAILNPNATTASVCEVSSIVVKEAKCSAQIDSEVFYNTLIVGLACIPTSFWLPLCIHRLGTKFFMIFSLNVAGAVAMGLYFVTNSAQNLALSAIFEALTSLALVTLFCSLVELFPTSVRVMASGLTICAGRIGGLIGNLTFGYLIDLNCIVPIVIFSFLLCSTGMLCFLLPKQKTKELN